MTDWISVLEEFTVPEPAPTVPNGTVPKLDRPPKAILFDVYGTLVCPLVGDLTDQAQMTAGVESFAATAERFGFSQEVGTQWQQWFFEAITREHLEQKEMGIAPAEVQVDHIWAELIARVGGDPALIEPRKVGAFREMLANPVRAFTGVAEALTVLHGSGLELGIVSNSQFYTMPILGRTLGIDTAEIFRSDLAFLSFRLGFAKPSPYFFRLVRTAVLHLGLEPEEVLVVGNDCDNDILAAQAHGFQTLLFCSNDENVRLGLAGKAGAMITNYKSLVAACSLSSP